MNDPGTILIQCDHPDQIVTTVNAVMPQLPKDLRRSFNQVKLLTLSRDNISGLFRLCNGRTVAQIMESAKDLIAIQPIASGEVDGLRYEVFEKPSSEAANGSDPPGNP